MTHEDVFMGLLDTKQRKQWREHADFSQDGVRVNRSGIWDESCRHWCVEVAPVPVPDDYSSWDNYNLIRLIGIKLLLNYGGASAIRALHDE